MELPYIDIELEAAYSKVKKGANWFYWISALSIINTILSTFDAQVNFVLGLGLTQFCDGITSVMNNATIKYICIGFEILVCGFFFVCGNKGGEFSKPFFIAGMVVYVLDAVLVGYFGAILACVFHLYALFFIFNGYRAIAEYETIKAKLDREHHLDASDHLVV